MEAAWEVAEVGDGSSPLVVHVPHSATWLPEAERHDLLLDDAGLDAELRFMTDWHTDRIAFDALAGAGVAAVIFANRASRLLIDPERLTGTEEPMPTWVQRNPRRPPAKDHFVSYNHDPFAKH